MFVFFALFAPFTSPGSSADLTPPYQADERGRVGHWEFGGACMVEEQSIELVPAVQFHKGYAWTNVEIPKGDWSIEFDFQIPEGNGGGGIGIWFCNTYMADGPINGGPNTFLGIGVLINVVTGRVPAQGLFLAIRFLERTDPYSPPFQINHPSPIATIPFDPREPFTVRLDFLKRNVTLRLNETEVTNREVAANLKDNYIGITAACESRVSKIELLSVRFTLDMTKKVLPTFRVEEILGEHKPSGHVHKQGTTALRGAAFNLTLAEYEKMRASRGELEGEGTAAKLFDMIDEVGAVNFEVASFSDLNDFADRKLLGYAQKWQSRTVKLVERVQQARNVAGAAWNYTQSVMEAFNSSLKHTVLKTTGKIEDLGDLLSEVGEKGIDEDRAMDRLVEGVNQSRIIQLILYAAEIEFIAVILFFLLVNIPPLKRRLLGGE
jgi:hypothetical protein